MNRQMSHQMKQVESRQPNLRLKIPMWWILEKGTMRRKEDALSRTL